MVRARAVGVVLVFMLAASAGRCLGQTTRPDVKGLISDLASDDPGVKSAAQKAIRLVPQEQLTGPAIEALPDEQWTVRAEALKLLARAGGVLHRPDDMSTRVAKLLKDPVWAVRMEAALALGSIRDARTLGALKEALKADDPLVRPAVARAIFASGGKIDAELFKTCLTDAQLEVQRAVTMWAGPAKMDASFAPVLIAALSDDRQDVRIAAVRMLGWFEGEAAKSNDIAGAVAKSLKDADPPVRREAAVALAAIGDPGVLAALNEAFGVDDPQVRPAIAAAIFRIDPKIDIGFIKACMVDKQQEVRWQAWAWLTPSRVDEKTMPLVTQALRGGDRMNALAAAALLGRLGSEQAGDLLAQTVNRQGASGELKYTAAQALIKCRGEAAADAMEPLVGIVNGPNLTALIGTLYAPKAAPAIAGILDNHPRHMRLEACMVLANLASPDTTEALLKFAKSPRDPLERRTAIYAIGRAGREADIDGLMELISLNDYPKNIPGELSSWVPHLTGGQPVVDTKKYWAAMKDDAARQAVWAVCVIGGEKAIAAVAKAMDDPRPGVRGMALGMLAELGDARGIDNAIKWLGGQDYHEVKGALAACHYYDDPRLAAALVELIKDERRGEAANTPDLGATGPYKAMTSSPSLGNVIYATWPALRDVRCQAMYILNEKRPKEARPVLLERLRDAQPGVVQQAMELLAKSPAREEIPAYMEVLGNKKAFFAQIPAAEALCKLKVKEAFDGCLLVVEQQKRNPSLTPALAQALGAWAHEGFAEKLKSELKSPDGKHYAALLTLAYADLPELAPECVPYMDDSDWEVRRQAILTLGRTKYVKVLPELLKMLGNSRSPTPAPFAGMAAEALGDMGDKSAVEPLTAFVEQYAGSGYTGSGVGSAARALGQLGDKRAVEVLIRAVRSEPEAAEGLGLLGDKRAVATLKITGQWARGAGGMAVARALFDLEPQACVDTAGRLVQTEIGFSQIKVDAIELLAKAGGAEAARFLKLAMRDESAVIRKQAREALVRIRPTATTLP